MRRQDRLCWSGAEHGQTTLLTSRLLICNCPLLAPYPSVFQRLFLPILPLFLLFAACGVSLKYSMVCFAQSQNAFPLQCIMCPVLSRNDSACEVPQKHIPILQTTQSLCITQQTLILTKLSRTWKPLPLTESSASNSVILTPKTLYACSQPL